MIPVVKKFTKDDMKKYNAGVIYHLQPLSDIHLYSHYMMEPGENGDGKTVYLLLGIAFFIVVIAWVNYINLATARAITRAKEVGVRKAVGSQRAQLIIQFLSESAVLNAIALLLALGIVVLAIPGFNAVSGQHLSFSLFAKPGFWLGLGSLFLIGVFLSGLYPAFVLSGFNPVDVLKGKLANSGKGSPVKKIPGRFSICGIFIFIDRYRGRLPADSVHAPAIPGNQYRPDAGDSTTAGGH